MNSLASGLHGELRQGARHLRVTFHASFHFVAILFGLYSALSLTLFLCDRRLYADQGARVKKKKHAGSLLCLWQGKDLCNCMAWRLL